MSRGKSRVVSICLIAIACCGCESADKRNARLRELARRHDWFLLRDSIDGNSPYIYQATVALVFHDIDGARKLAQRAVRANRTRDPKSPAPPEVEAHNLLCGADMLEFRYSEALSEYRLAGKPGESDYEAFLEALSHLRPQSVTKREYSTLRWKLEQNSVTVPLLVNGKSVAYGLDTGAFQCVVSEQEAAFLGLSILDSPHTRMQGPSGNWAEARIGVANELAIGGFHLKDVLFLVLQRDTVFGGRPLGGQGVLGLPVLFALETIRWSKDGAFEAGFPAARDSSIRSANLSFDPETGLVTRGEVQDKAVNLLVDSGADTTDLLPRFSKDFPSLEHYSVAAEPRTRRDVGGSTVLQRRLVPGLQLSVGGLPVSLTNLSLFDHDQGSPWCHARIGMDVIQQAGSFSLDFRSMILKLGP